MGFQSRDLAEKGEAFKRFLKQQSINVRMWAARHNFSENAAYSWLDVSRSDNHLPAFMIETLPVEAAKNILFRIYEQLRLRETSAAGGEGMRILKQFTVIQREFAEYSAHLIKAVEDGEISEEELGQYLEKWAALESAQTRLFGLLYSQRHNVDMFE